MSVLGRAANERTSSNGTVGLAFNAERFSRGLPDQLRQAVADAPMNHFSLRLGVFA